MSITSIELPAEDGMEWREVDSAEYSGTSTSERRAIITDFPSYKTRYFINVKIEPEWVSIPEGTLCRISYRTTNGSVEKVAERYGQSFKVVGWTLSAEPDKVLSAKPVRLLSEDEVAVKKVSYLTPAAWRAGAKAIRDLGYPVGADLFRAYADALEKEGTL